MRIERITAPAPPQALAGLAELLRDAVAGNASVGFSEVPAIAEAETWWTAWLDSPRVVLAAFDDGDRMLGTVTVVPASYPSGRHRAEIAKLLVHSTVRRRGAGSRLMAAAEAAALASGRTTLLLDTETGSGAESLYLHLGWSVAGSIPKFCYRPDGALTPTTFYFKHLD